MKNEPFDGLISRPDTNENNESVKLKIGQQREITQNETQKKCVWGRVEIKTGHLRTGANIKWCSIWEIGILEVEDTGQLREHQSG